MRDDEAPGLRRIGSLTSKIVDMHSPKASTPTRSPKSSETTGTPRQDLVPSSSTGTQRGASGALALQKQMARNDPEATDTILQARLEQLLGQHFVSREREKVDPVYGWDSELIGYSLRQPVSASAMAAARALASAALEPMPQPEIVKELLKLKRLTKSRAEPEADLEAIFVAFAEELADYPPDVIRCALRQIARHETFFPSLNEIIAECQPLTHKRRCIARALGLED